MIRENLFLWEGLLWVDYCLFLLNCLPLCQPHRKQLMYKAILVRNGFLLSLHVHIIVLY